MDPPCPELGLKKEDGAALSPAAFAGLNDSQGAAARPGVPCISGDKVGMGGQARLPASGQVAAPNSLGMSPGTA